MMANRQADSRCSINDHTGFHAVCISSVVGIYHRSGSGPYRKADVEAATGGLYLPPGHPSYEVLVGKADERLLKSIMTNPSHVLSKYLPKLKDTGLNLRPRAHGYELPPKDDLNFIPRTPYNALLRK